MKIEGFFEPFSWEEVKRAIEGREGGNLYAIQINMSRVCRRAACLYCDSPLRAPGKEEISWEELRKFLEVLKELGVGWIHVCGYGEPFDDEKFQKLLEWTKNNKIRVCAFTNGLSEIDKVLKEYNNLYLIIKLDSLNPDTSAKLMGISKEKAEAHKERILKILEEYGGKGRVAVSIVPTRLNFNLEKGVLDVLEVFFTCLKYKVFPLLGDLEKLGRTHATWQEIGMEESDLRKLRDEIERIFGIKYQTPLCPSILGIFVDPDGNIITDRYGIPCPYYECGKTTGELVLEGWGNVREIIKANNPEEELRGVLDRIFRYQREMLSTKEAENYFENLEKKVVFGGCGGKPFFIYAVFRKLFGSDVDSNQGCKDYQNV